jgi:acylphosphatase
MPAPDRREALGSGAGTVRVRVVVHGQVQGVFFRDTIRGHARQRGLAGWVRNCADGTVEAVFEGPGEPVDRLVELSREGPRGARVERVERFEERPEGLTGFSVID